MVTWKEVYVQEEMRKVRMAEAEQVRMVKAAKSEEKDSTKENKVYLLKLYAATKLVKWGDALRALGSEMSLAGEG
jgi:hypothetical protein